jgi:hypothetical protein
MQLSLKLCLLSSSSLAHQPQKVRFCSKHKSHFTVTPFFRLHTTGRWSRSGCIPGPIDGSHRQGVKIRVDLMCKHRWRKMQCCVTPTIVSRSISTPMLATTYSVLIPCNKIFPWCTILGSYPRYSGMAQGCKRISFDCEDPQGVSVDASWLLGATHLHQPSQFDLR